MFRNVTDSSWVLPKLILATYAIGTIVALGAVIQLLLF